MKTVISGLAFMAMAFTACNGDNSTAKTTTPSEVTKSETKNDTASASTAEVVQAYLQLKNALAADNGSGAAAAGTMLKGAIDSMAVSAFSAAQRKVYDDVKDDIREHAEHIEANGGKIEHQREHFDMLSRDMYDLVKVLPPPQTLYQDHCPMYNNGKGANWLSAEKAIQNPYLGKKMPDCGTVKETIGK